MLHAHFHQSLDLQIVVLDTGGINSDVSLTQIGSNIFVSVFGLDIQSVRWQIHELPVDLSIDPKLRCKPEHVGQYLHSGKKMDYIYNVTAASLVMHSIVLLVNEEPATCGTIIPYYGWTHSSPFTIVFKSGVFGRAYIMGWPGEYTDYSKTYYMDTCNWPRDCTYNMYINFPYYRYSVTVFSLIASFVWECTVSAYFLWGLYFVDFPYLQISQFYICRCRSLFCFADSR